MPTMTPTDSPTLESIVLGGGCFWCLEAAYQEITGVQHVASGYAGGQRPDPTYDQVSSGATGHAEVVQIQFDPGVITLDDILDIFWVIHNPTTPNQQGNDIGTEYRSIILYTDVAQEHIAEASKTRIQQLWPDPVTTQIVLLEHFYLAEPEHQNYYRNHPERAYCQIVINPKLHKLREKFQSRLKA